MEKPILQDSPSFVDLCTLHQHAMRYYRLWIYACNTVLAVATLVFLVFAVSVAVDPRLSLLDEVKLYQPTFLYAYIALTFQLGVLQAIGCVGALRLNQRLLNIYWAVLLVLMIGDVITGLIWAFRLDHIKSNLRPMLKNKLITLYGKDDDFTEVWDWVQTNDMCCGVDGPIDFQRINESAFGGLDANGLSNDTWTSYLLNQQDRLQNQQTIPKLPSTCCIFTVNPYEPTTTEIPISSEIPGGGGEHFRSRSHHKGRGNGGSTNRDRWNDPRNQIPTPGGYYQQPQQLKGSFQNSNYNNNNYHYNNQNKNNPTVSYRDNDINSMNSYNYNNNDSSLQTSSFMSNNLVISDLRQSTLTDQISGLPASAMGYYAPGAQAPQPMSGGTYHNRRKVALASKKQGEERRWGSRGSFTTTEGPPAGRPSPATIGVCVLPSHLRQQYASSASSSNSGESGSNSFEDSSEMYSTTSIPPPHVTSSPSTITTITPKTEPPTLTSSTPASTEQPSSSPPSTSVPLSSPRSTHPKFNGGSHSSSGNNGQHNRHHHHSTPFTVGMEQHMDGCGDKVLEWVEHSSDVLFVIGFCIIVFLKGCFIAILRYEIKEMIEKIKLLNGEDAGRTAAMNELIGLTSMYETGNDDNGEREGLMSGVHNGNQDTSTNVDGVDADNGSGGAAVASTGCEATRKDSGPYIKENHLIGNNVGPPRFIGNHVGTTGSVDTTNKEDYPRVLGVGRNSVTGGAGEEDFNDSKSSLFGQKPCDGPPLLGNSKHYLQFHHHHLHRNENGGRSVPRNGNNNNSGGTGTGEPLPLTSFENPNVGVPTSASAPSIPSDAMARVTNAPIH